jgi:hypothetical protein
MKKSISILALFGCMFLYSQDVYQKGFSAGYKAGYCYNILGCIAPVSPIGNRDIKSDFQTGYNNGFVIGQQDQRSNNQQYNSNTGGALGQLKPSVQDLDLNVDPNHMRELWADYYEKRRIKKERKAAEKAKMNAAIPQLVVDHTTEVIGEIDKLKNRLKGKNISDIEIEKITNNLHHENETIYNKYKDKVEKYGDFYVENKKLKEKISKL